MPALANRRAMDRVNAKTEIQLHKTAFFYERYTLMWVRLLDNNRTPPHTRKTHHMYIRVSRLQIEVTCTGLSYVYMPNVLAVYSMSARYTRQHDVNGGEAKTLNRSVPVSKHEQAGSHQVEGQENARADDRVERVEGDQQCRNHAHAPAHLKQKERHCNG